MKVEIAEHGRMSESGSSLLRLIQNQDMPLLDLLVRESVQNSLDASNGAAPDVKVDFSIGQFQSADLNKHLDGIQKPLDKRFPNKKAYNYISVRDSNTYGLTGPVSYDKVVNNEFGNLLKLVYEICKPQQNEGAGGSWGLGKTIYFRVGIGLVIYYSRICQNGKYSSRLAACLVEDETKRDALIPHSGGVKRGIAWWGKADRWNSKKTVPITSEREIKDILSVFGIKPYSAEETGTTIIIPYIRKQALLDEVYAKNEDTDLKPYWAKSVGDYLRVALQKWYAPRISNPHYPYGAYLTASVDGVKIKAASMLPLFRTVRELYILASGGTLDSEALLADPQINCNVESVDLRGVFSGGQSAGKFAYVKLTNKQLMMLPPENNKAPYQQITNSAVHMESGNIPIIMYTRRPGMIVGYDFDGPWTHRMPKTAESEYVIGLFVINSGNKLKNIKESGGTGELSLEEYIRKGEKADHASWADRNISGNNPRIVTNIQKGIFRKITAKYSERTIDTTEKRNIGLGHALANILLPSSDFGRVASPPQRPGGGGGGGTSKPSKRKSSLSFGNGVRYMGDRIAANFDLHMKTNACELSLLLLTDFKKYKAEKWESDDEIGKAFPLHFVRFTIECVRPNKKNAAEINKKLTVDTATMSCNDEDIQVETISSERFAVPSTIHISSAMTNVIVCGTLEFTSDDPRFKGIIDLKEV